MRTIKVLIFALLFSQPCISSPAEFRISSLCNVLEYGATGDGRTDDSISIQRCINICNEGVVFFPPGVFLVGQLRVSGIGRRVQLASGARIIQSDQRDAYHGDQSTWYALMLENCVDCVLEGDGLASILDGQAQAWVNGTIPGDRKTVRNFVDPSCKIAKQCRPFLLGVLHSSHVRLSGLHITDAIFWTTHIVNSSHVTLEHLHIFGDYMIANNDGIDIDSSTDVRVHNVYVDTADDGICIKTTLPSAPVVNVHVSNCTVASKSAAIKFGSGSHSDFRNVTFEDILVRPSHRALGLQLRDAGSAEGLVFRNIRLTAQLTVSTWWGAGEAIIMSVLPRHTGQTVLGSLRDVTFENVSGVSEGGIVFVGTEASPIGSLVMRNVDLGMRKLSDFAGGERDLQPGPASREKNVSIPALFSRHVNSLVLEDVRLEVAGGAKSRADWGRVLDMEHGPVQLSATGLQAIDYRR